MQWHKLIRNLDLKIEEEALLDWGRTKSSKHREYLKMDWKNLKPTFMILPDPFLCSILYFCVWARIWGFEWWLILLMNFVHVARILEFVVDVELLEWGSEMQGEKSKMKVKRRGGLGFWRWRTHGDYEFW